MTLAPGPTAPDTRDESWRRRLTVERCGVALWLGGVGTLSLAIIDAIVRTHDLAMLLPVRAAALAVVLLLLLLQRSRYGSEYPRILVFSVYVPAVVSIAHVPRVLGQLPSGYSFGGLIVLFTAMGVLVPVGWRVHIAAQIASLAYYIALNGHVLGAREQGEELVVDAVYLFWVMLSINVSVAMFERLRDSEVRAKLELQHLASIDGLTGVYGRRHLMALARREFERARRYGTKLSAIMIDVDRFKQINEDHGHLVGDRVLFEAAQRLRRTLRDVDVFGRYGGEEFVAMLPETDLETATSVVAERLRAVMHEQPFVTDGTALDVTISLGVAELVASIDDLDALLRAADTALFAAKRGGRDRVVGSRPGGARARDESPPVSKSVS